MLPSCKKSVNNAGISIEGDYSLLQSLPLSYGVRDAGSQVYNLKNNLIAFTGKGDRGIWVKVFDKTTKDKLSEWHTRELLDSFNIPKVDSLRSPVLDTSKMPIIPLKVDMVKMSIKDVFVDNNIAAFIVEPDNYISFMYARLQSPCYLYIISKGKEIKKPLFSTFSSPDIFAFRFGQMPDSENKNLIPLIPARIHSKVDLDPEDKEYWFLNRDGEVVKKVESEPPI
ncbi:hypothetical protein GCM10027516_05980 [Niabella aquatica]